MRAFCVVALAWRVCKFLGCSRSVDCLVGCWFSELLSCCSVRSALDACISILRGCRALGPPLRYTTAMSAPCCSCAMYEYYGNERRRKFFMVTVRPPPSLSGDGREQKQFPTSPRERLYQQGQYHQMRLCITYLVIPSDPTPGCLQQTSVACTRSPV